MIVVFEQDRRLKLWKWLPHAFRGRWQGGRCWRVGWGLWSLSYFPSANLRSYINYIAERNVCWHDQ